MTIEVKPERVPWVQIVILTFIFSFIAPIWVSMLPTTGNNWYALGGIGCALFLTATPFLFIIGASFLKKVGVSIQDTTLTWLYAVGVGLSQIATSTTHPITDDWLAIQATSYLDPEKMSYVPWFVAPRREIAEQIVMGGVPVPWVEWLPSLLFWWAIWASGAIFYVSLAALFRRQWVDIERVPFPHTTVMHEVIKKTTSSGKFVEKLGRPLSIGLILGVIFQFPLMMTNLFPWFPDIYGWRVNTCGTGAQWLTTDSPLASIVGLAMFNKDPLVAAILYMAPLNVLLGGVFWYIVFVVLMQLAFVMGYYTGITDLAGCGRVWCGTISYRVGDPFKWDVFTTAGVGTGITIFWLLLNRRYLADTFKAAFGGITEEKRHDLEKDEPISYRTLYIILIGSFFLQLAVWLITDMGIAPALTLIIVSFIFTIAQTRTYSYVGFYAPGGSYFHYGYMKLVMGEGTEPPTRQWVTAFLFTYPTGQAAYVGWGYPFASTLASFKMGSFTNVGSKNIFKILMFTSVVAPLVATIGAVWALYAFGLQRLPTANNFAWSYIESRAWPSGLARRPAYAPWAWHLVGGIIWAGILSYMHARFIWFPFEPIGFLLAMDGHALVEGLWTMVTLAWVLKVLTIRVGGSKLYEKTGIPAATGFVIGFISITILGGILLIIRFFVPF